MRLSRIAALVLISISAASLAQAQQPREWVPEAVEALRASASSKTEFTLDHSMLVLASKLDPNNQDLRRVIAGVNGVSVHSYRFPGAWAYDPDALTAVKQGYKDAGWTQLLNNHDKNGGPGVTELWIRLEDKAISDVAVLAAKPNQVNLIVVSGAISPLDLVHLGGHFGIPKMAGGEPLPNADRRQ
ncbi:MAG: DUF4252 domain-containing protein [Candidatus Sulfotelmatobacter sp.]